MSMNEYVPGQKDIPFEILAEFKGSELAGLRYEQLLPYAQPETGDAFLVVTADFVTTEDGTGIVHIAPKLWCRRFQGSQTKWTWRTYTRGQEPAALLPKIWANLPDVSLNRNI